MSRFILDRGVRKAVKSCLHCERDMVWRKKWERCWDEVQYCSKRCRSTGRADARAAVREDGPLGDPDRGGGGSGESGGRGGRGGGGGRGRGEQNDALSPAERKAARAEKNAQRRAERRRGRNGGAGGGEANTEDDDSKTAAAATSNGPMASMMSMPSVVPSSPGSSGSSVLDPDRNRKPCDVCAKRVDMTIRCQTDATKRWRMVCSACWPSVSGGVTDGDAAHPHYTYGGVWKNRKG